MKKILVLILAAAMCLVIAACGNNSKDNTDTTKKDNVQTTTTPSVVDPDAKVVTDEAKGVGATYKIDLDKLPIEYNMIDGTSVVDGKQAEITVHLSKELTKEEKIATHDEWVDYFKSIADDGKVYNMYTDEEYDKADTEASGIWLRVILNDNTYKVYIGGHTERDGYPGSYRVTFTIVEK